MRGMAMDLLQPRRRTDAARTWALVGTAVAALLLAGCGTRVSDAEANEQFAGAYTGQGVPGAAGDSGLTAGEDLPGGVGDGAGAKGPGSSSGIGSSGDAGADSSGGPGGGASGAAGSGAGGGDGGGGSGAPIVLGMTGSWSGISGASQASARDAYAAWAKVVNARGGIDGHPIELLIADNQGSASQDLANAKQFVEEEGAIALVNLFPAIDADPAIEKYARSQNVPIVGGVAVEDIWTESPVMFPASGAFNAPVGWAKAMKDAGKSSAAAIYCTEQDVCKEMEQRWAQHAENLGIDVVYEGGASVAQPDFTAQCVEARNRGAEALVTVLDGASANRVAQACDRQGYHPLLVNPNPFADVPSYAEGMVGVMASFPWFVTSGSPALEEYGAAISKYVTNKTNTFTSGGWIDAKLLEKALEHGVSAKPTSQDVFEGLWAMKNETLGGLTPPITFNKGKPPTPIRCVYSGVVDDGKWVAPAGAKPTLCM